MNHANSHFPLSRTLLAAVVLACPLWAAATPPVDQFGSFSHTCGGVINGAGLPVQTIDLSGMFWADQQACKEAFSPFQAKVKSKVTHTGTSGSGSGQAQAAPGGKLRVRASNDSVGVGGEAAGAIAGFTDVLLVDAPGFNGESGIIYYKVRVKGTLDAHGPSGAAVFRILPLVPHLPTGWKDWSISTDPLTPDAFLAVDETAVVFANMVFGQPLNLSTVAWAHAGVRSMNGQGHATVAFDGKNAVRLLGIDHVVTYFGVPVTNYTVTSQAGLPW